MVSGGGPPQVRALVRKLWLYRPGGRSSGRRVKTTSASSSSSAPSIESGGGGSSLAKAVLSSAATCGAFSLLSDTMVQTMEIRYRANQRSREGGASPAPAKEMSGKVKAKKFEISRPTQDGEEVVGEVVVVAEPRGESVSRHFSRLRKSLEVSLNLLWLTSLAAIPREYEYRPKPKEGGKTR